jgi:integrase
MRREELCGARWENLSIEADSGLLWIDDTKHPDSAVRQGRFVSLSPVAIELLREIGIEDDGLIFDVQPDSLTQAFGRARERAGLEGIRLGDTRREAASRKAEDGWTLPMVMAFTGHKDVRTLAGIYLRLRAKLLSQRMHGTSPADSRPGTWD